MPLMARGRSTWTRFLLWHGWLLGLSTAGERDRLGGFSGSVDSQVTSDHNG